MPRGSGTAWDLGWISIPVPGKAPGPAPAPAADPRSSAAVPAPPAPRPRGQPGARRGQLPEKEERDKGTSYL